MFEDRTEDYHRNEGGERHVRTVSETCWISVLHRMTGFGYMEWETAICFRDLESEKIVKGCPLIVRGDWREELEDMPESGLLEWYAGKHGENKTMFDSLLDVLKSV